MQSAKADPGIDPATPFRVNPADVPPDAVRFVKRTLLRQTSDADPDDELARVIVAGLMTILPAPSPARPPTAPPPRRRTRTAAADVHGMAALF